MLLRVIRLTNFRSVKGTIEIDMDPRVTVLLGSNDHGKTNILNAFERINVDAPLTEDDSNWDADAGPGLEFEFVLLPEEAKRWEEFVTTDETDKSDDADQPPVEGGATQEPVVAETSKELAEEPAPHPTIGTSGESLVTIARRGVGGTLEVQGVPADKLPENLAQYISQITPRVELFNPLSGSLQDAVDATQIATPEYEFMQGVFFMAGLDPMDCASLFKQNDRTMRDLDNASSRLNDNLRSLWEQGKFLTFELRHQGSTIQLVVNDPAVKSRKVRMSRRSGGVTQFFRISMVLYARQQKNRANSYVYLFDEPGVFLHVQGQKDLLQVFEQLAEKAQIVYATHSLFMLNQNFPERHRLVFKDDEGTKIDQKPYRANWRRATDSLGVYWNSSILFSTKVLLVEGDSDPIYVYELIRQLTRRGDIDADTNVLGVMSFETEGNLRYLLQQFRGQMQENKVMVLVDGDREGQAFKKKVATLCERLEVPIESLGNKLSVEDYVLFPGKWLAAIVQTLRDALEAEQKPIPVDLDQRVRDGWQTHRSSPAGTAGRWFKGISKAVVDTEVSKVALARNYAFLCREEPDAQPNTAEVDVSRAIHLAKGIAEFLGLPSIRAKEEIVESGASSEETA